MSLRINNNSIFALFKSMANHLNKHLLILVLLSLAIRVVGLDRVAHVRYSNLHQEQGVSLSAVLSDDEIPDSLFWLDEEDSTSDSYITTGYNSWPKRIFSPSSISIAVPHSSRLSRRYILYCSLKLDC